MTSLLKHVNDLDRAEGMRRVAFDSYVEAIRAIAQYAIEVDHATTTRHRGYLEAIRAQLVERADPETVAESQASLRAELRDYRDRCEKQVESLKQDFTAAIQSLQQVMLSIATSERDHSAEAKRELTALTTVAATGTLDEIRKQVYRTVETVSARFDALVRDNELTIAQFRDEIRTLQVRLQAAESAQALDAASGALNRKEFENRVRRLVIREKTLSVQLLKVPNYHELRSRYGQVLIDELAKAIFKRTRNELGDTANIARWTEDMFVATIVADKQKAMARCRELAMRLSGAYVCMEDGHATRIAVSVLTAVTEYEASDTGEDFVRRIEKLASSLP